MKPVWWMGSSREDVRRFPEAVRDGIGWALYHAQLGQKGPQVKPLRGFGGAQVLEVVESHDGDAFRAVYTVRFAEAVVVLHCFQKKSKSGVAMPRQDRELIEARLKAAQAWYTKWIDQKESK